MKANTHSPEARKLIVLAIALVSLVAGIFVFRPFLENVCERFTCGAYIDGMLDIKKTRTLVLTVSDSIPHRYENGRTYFRDDGLNRPIRCTLWLYDPRHADLGRAGEIQITTELPCLSKGERLEITYLFKKEHVPVVYRNVDCPPGNSWKCIKWKIQLLDRDS